MVKPIALKLLGLREEDVELYFQEVQTRLLEETDYRLELQSSLALTEASRHLATVRFPTYHPELSSKHVLTSEWIEGMHFDRFADGPASQAERDQIGQALWDFYDHQVHELLNFHADPHPGNFLIQEGTLCVLDFGCTKRISREFYKKQFRFLDPSLCRNTAALEEALRDMNVLLPTDSREQVRQVMLVTRSWLELLAKPFHSGRFDFGAPEFLQSIYELGEKGRKDENMRSMKGQRGCPDSVYVNRAFFGLYSLLGRLRARVNCLPR